MLDGLGHRYRAVDEDVGDRGGAPGDKSLVARLARVLHDPARRSGGVVQPPQHDLRVHLEPGCASQAGVVTRTLQHRDGRGDCLQGAAREVGPADELRASGLEQRHPGT